MTTIVYDRRNKLIVADTQYTGDDLSIVRVNKIERISGKRYYLGSGHSYPLAIFKTWAEKEFDPEEEPDWSTVLEHGEDMRFTALVVSPDGEQVWMMDNELALIEPMDEVLGVGTGSAFALAAMDAGADAIAAVEIACRRDIYSSPPITVHRIGKD